jgi:CrcB protein
MTILIVAVAGAGGVSARYGVGHATSSMWATFCINVIGSLLLGIFVHAGRHLDPALRDAISVGFLGGLTTFSTFSMQAVLEADAARVGSAALYVIASVLCGIAAAAVGYHGAKGLPLHRGLLF